MITLSSKNNFEELKSFLFSLYCLVYSIDSVSLKYEFEKILKYRLKGSSFLINENDIILPNNLNNVLSLLSIFKEPIKLELFASICSDYGLNISPAELKLITSVDPDQNIIIKKKKMPKEDHIKYIANWIGNQFEAIPIKSFPRYLTVYYKDTIEKYSETLKSCLLDKIGWINILGKSKSAKKRFYRISEFFKQTGRWKDWLLILDNAETFLRKNNILFEEIIRNKLWILPHTTA